MTTRSTEATTVAVDQSLENPSMAMSQAASTPPLEVSTKPQVINGSSLDERAADRVNNDQVEIEERAEMPVMTFPAGAIFILFLCSYSPSSLYRL